MQRPTRTSYSGISTYEGCGAQYEFSYIQGIEAPSGEAAARGTRLHTGGESFLKGQLTFEALPVDYWRVKKDMAFMKQQKAKSETVICVDKDWKVVPKNHPSTVIKCIIDVHWFHKPLKILNITDLKTGKIYRDEHTDQLQLYATAGYSAYPSAQTVKVNGLYLDQGRKDCEATYPVKMLPHLRKHWMERAIKVLTATEFKPNPTEDNCKWCFYNKKRKGGPCAAGV